MPLQDNQPAQVGVPIVLLVLDLHVLAARFYIRLTRKMWGLDDWFMALGIVFYILQCVTTIGSALNGIGLQTEHITSNNQYIQGGKWFYFYNIAYTFAATFVRLSALKTLLRIVTTRGYKASIYTAAFIVSAIGLQNVIFLLIQCKPIAWYWDKTILPTGSCFDGPVISANTITVNFVAAATDVFTAVLPIILLWNLRMNLRTKISVCILLGLGIFASICIVVRLPISVNLQYHQESFYDVSITVIWAAAETGIGIIAASLYTLRPIFQRFIGSSAGTSNNANGYSYSKGGRVTLPNAMFRSGGHTNGITRLSELGENETWRDGIRIKDSDEASDTLDKKQFELDEMNPKAFLSKTVISGGPSTARMARSEGSGEDLSGDVITGDANSETEILDNQHRYKGITIAKTFKVEVKRGSNQNE